MNFTLLPQGPGPMSAWSTYVVLGIIAIAMFSLVACIFFAKYFNLWIQAKMTGRERRDPRVGRHVVPQGEPQHHRPLEDHGVPGRASPRRTG